jgi:hypothetical protein
MTVPASPALAIGRDLLTRPGRYLSLTPVQRAAYELFDMGLSVGPTRPVSKLPYLWRKLYTTRIDPAAIPELFTGRAGIFVVTGATSGNLAVLDCETLEAARQHAAEFDGRNLRPWRLTTPRGAHFWWLSADGELANRKDDASRPRGWELRGRCCYVMTPPSIHPSGVIYDWSYREGERPPIIESAALDWLGAELHAKVRRKPTALQAEGYPELSRASREFIAGGAPSGQRNNRLFAAACDLAGNGYRHNDARDVLTPAALGSGLPAKEAADTIASAYRKTRTPAKSSRQAPPAPGWALARTWADAHTFTSLSAERSTTPSRPYRVSGATARAVFIACCERARREHPSAVFRASVREVAELARLRFQTAQAALRCLVAAGHLRHCGYNPAGASLFAFAAGVLRKRNSSTYWSLCTVPLMEHAAWARGSLGETARRAWALLLAEPMRASDVALRLNVSRSTAGRTLAALAQHGLAERGPGRVWQGLAAASADLDTIAAATGVTARDAARRALHERQRSADVTAAILRRMRASQK